MESDKFKQHLYAMSKLQTGELKLADHMAHILADRGEQIHPMLPHLFGFGLHETAAIPTMLPSVSERVRGVEQFAIIDGSSGQFEGAQATRRITLLVQLNAIPSPHPALGLARPVPNYPVLLCTSNVTDRNRRPSPKQLRVSGGWG